MKNCLKWLAKAVAENLLNWAQLIAAVVLVLVFGPEDPDPLTFFLAILGVTVALAILTGLLWGFCHKLWSAGKRRDS
ncbi:hypothetical protein RPE78_16910 (plasmid) [Thioclava litoralis]|uniref:Holin-X, holin superfamily III n=1 Tax=Thioclava litoralis TaxID=3076557 RepID=A0ABZ1E3B8_9RHOB|nr:hypothetical protein RPE78_16910 [Thioclava sp. FTW29]